MTGTIVGVLSPQDGISLSLKVLAVIGGATLGGLLIGALGGLLVRSLTTRPIPVWAKRTLRVLGAVAAGWLVYFFVFRGPDRGGPGGDSEGGKSAGKDHHDNDGKRPKEKEDEKKGNEKNPAAEERVVVEILGEAALKELGHVPADVYRGFRIRGEKKLYTKDDLVDELRKRRKQTPGLKVELKSYGSSPDLSLNGVPALQKWLADEGMLVEEKPK